MTDATKLLLQTLGLLALLGVGTIAIMILRSWSLHRGRADDAGSSFTLQDLREMREHEQISEAEYKTMRAAIIGAHVDDTSRAVAGASSTSQRSTDADDHRDDAYDPRGESESPEQ